MEAIDLSLKQVFGTEALLVEDIGMSLKEELEVEIFLEPTGMSSKEALEVEALLKPMGMSSKEAGFSGRSCELSSWDNLAGDGSVGDRFTIHNSSATNFY